MVRQAAFHRHCICANSEMWIQSSSRSGGELLAQTLGISSHGSKCLIVVESTTFSTLHDQAFLGSSHLVDRLGRKATAAVFRENDPGYHAVFTPARVVSITSKWRQKH